jgi:ribosomal protein L7Ae-like RNA K-turn-binding protein
VAASVKVGIRELDCEVRTGTRSDVILAAATANTAHGLQRTSADKRRAITLVLSDKTLARLSNTRIAKLVGVTDKTVEKRRQELKGGFGQSDSADAIPEVRTHIQGGKEVTARATRKRRKHSVTGARAETPGVADGDSGQDTDAQDSAAEETVTTEVANVAGTNTDSSDVIFESEYPWEPASAEEQALDEAMAELSCLETVAGRVVREVIPSLKDAPAPALVREAARLADALRVFADQLAEAAGAILEPAAAR